MLRRAIEIIQIEIIDLGLIAAIVLVAASDLPVYPPDLVFIILLAIFVALAVAEPPVQVVLLWLIVRLVRFSLFAYFSLYVIWTVYWHGQASATAEALTAGLDCHSCEATGAGTTAVILSLTAGVLLSIVLVGRLVAFGRDVQGGSQHTARSWLFFRHTRSLLDQSEVLDA